MSKIKSYQEQVQEIVEKAIAAVEEQHKALSEKTFSYAEKLASIDTIKAKYDDYAYLAYDKARDANKSVGTLASDLISKFEKEETPVAKAKTTAKKAATTAKKKATTAKAKVAKKVEEATA